VFYAFKQQAAQRQFSRAEGKKAGLKLHSEDWAATKLCGCSLKKKGAKNSQFQVRRVTWLRCRRALKARLAE
jgi:hypothetical protein